MGHSFTKRKRDKRKRTGTIKGSVINIKIAITTFPSSAINHERIARMNIAKYTRLRKSLIVCARI